MVPVAVLTTPKVIPCKSLIIINRGRLAATKYNAELKMQESAPAILEIRRILHRDVEERGQPGATEGEGTAN